MLSEDRLAFFDCFYNILIRVGGNNLGCRNEQLFLSDAFKCLFTLSFSKNIYKYDKVYIETSSWLKLLWLHCKNIIAMLYNCSIYVIIRVLCNRTSMFSLWLGNWAKITKSKVTAKHAVFASHMPITISIITQTNLGLINELLSKYCEPRR